MERFSIFLNVKFNTIYIKMEESNDLIQYSQIKHI